MGLPMRHSTDVVAPSRGESCASRWNAEGKAQTEHDEEHAMVIRAEQCERGVSGRSNL